MKKTFITTMPDHIGAFLKASECFATLGVNITRVSYNKAVDSNTLFIDAEGSSEQLAEASRLLESIGYLGAAKSDNSIVLLEFTIRDKPGGVTEVLRLISEFSFNISYISSQENGTDYQLFKMGLFVDDADKISQFIAVAEKIICTSGKRTRVLLSTTNTLWPKRVRGTAPAVPLFALCGVQSTICFHRHFWTAPKGPKTAPKQAYFVQESGSTVSWTSTYSIRSPGWHSRRAQILSRIFQDTSSPCRSCCK